MPQPNATYTKGATRTPHEYWFLKSNVLEKVTANRHELSIDTLFEEPLGARFVIDGLCLDARTNSNYQKLEDALVGYVKGFQSSQSYNNVRINEIGDAFSSVLLYVDFLVKTFKLGSESKPNIERLKIELMRALIERIGQSYAHQFIPEDGYHESLFERAESTHLRQKESIAA